MEVPISLYFDLNDLIKTVSSEADDERYAVEVLASAFRRTLASYVLLESGLPHEAHIVLRNALELMLIAIDITYDEISLMEWKKTVNEDLKEIDYNNWYFKKKNICERIKLNRKSKYPELDRNMAIGLESNNGNGICKEWEVISNMSVHEHSQAQIRKHFDSNGDFILLVRKKNENYENDLKQYRIFIMNIIALLLGISKYKDLIGKTTFLLERANNFAQNYSLLQQEIGIKENQLEKCT